MHIKELIGDANIENREVDYKLICNDLCQEAT